MIYTNAFNSAINHCMLYEVSANWDVNLPGVKDGTNMRNCGYTNDSNDPGGETKYGISKNKNPNIDIARLDWPSAEAIYYNDYWLAGHCDKLPGRIAALQFDGNVNNGVNQSAKFLQRSIGVVADGSIGPATLAAIANADPINVCNLICNQRAIFYNDIVSRNPSQSIYLNGWLRRINEMRVFTTNLANNF